MKNVQEKRWEKTGIEEKTIFKYIAQQLIDFCANFGT